MLFEPELQALANHVAHARDELSRALALVEELRTLHEVLDDARRALRRQRLADAVNGRGAAAAGAPHRPSRKKEPVR